MHGAIRVYLGIDYACMMHGLVNLQSTDPCILFTYYQRSKISHEHPADTSPERR
jgi:hypothetical protein